MKTHGCASPSRAFTLIELLIVVAIIAVLAAIAVPNFLEAQTRAKVARTQSDIRALVTATETYHIDHGKYPLPSNPDGEFMAAAAAAAEEWFETKTPITITTPIAYISRRVGDVFAKKDSAEAQNFHYTSMTHLQVLSNNNPASDAMHVYDEYYTDLKGEPPPSAIGYFYLSFGPDQDHDIDEPHSEPGGEHHHEHGEGAIYDATNGTVSSGDIHFIGPGPGFL